MTVKEIVEKCLKENGYNGLYCDSCGCEIGDLMPCYGNSTDCQPGYRIEGCTEECGLGCDFHIGPRKASDE
ncbi:MAG: hypothetical protein ACFFCW_01975 [Candidatus Hodarchaeota archaeon]